jgi:hypothetical protein
MTREVTYSEKWLWVKLPFTPMAASVIAAVEYRDEKQQNSLNIRDKISHPYKTTVL